MEPTEQDAAAAVEAAETPLEDMEPVELEEVDEDGEQPPESWGRDGAGQDDGEDDAEDDAEVSGDGGH